MRNFGALFATLILTIGSSAYAGLFGPSNYEECVLDGLKDAKTDGALVLLMNFCSDKFNTNKKQSESKETDSIVFKECDSPRLRAYAEWIVVHKDRKGTDEWNKVARKYKEMRQGCK